MSPEARFRGGGPIDGHQRDLPRLVDRYEVVSSGVTLTYLRTTEADVEPAVYELHRSRRGAEQDD